MPIIATDRDRIGSDSVQGLIRSAWSGEPTGFVLQDPPEEYISPRDYANIIHATRVVVDEEEGY